MSFLKNIFGTKKPEPVKAPVYKGPVTPAPIAEPVQQQTTTPAISIKITTVEVDDEPFGEVSHIDFGKPAGSLGCFLSYDPPVLLEPTEKQLAYLKNLGVPVPAGVTKQDASYMISRATGEDSVEGPSSELVSLALGLGVKFSAFVGATGLMQCIVNSLKDRDRAALYVYAVRQSIRGAAFGNMLADPDKDFYYSFADSVISDAALVKSLNGRDPSDFCKPNKGTSIYKRAAAFLAGGVHE